MHFIKRAIIMAAGIGQRMQPVTFTTPKPLIRVNGVRMIETIINALHTNGIFEIYIVVGYLKEQFDEVVQKYEGVRLIDNPLYNECNNIASLYFARNHLEDCMILDGDQIILNDAVLFSEFEKSGYSAVWTDVETCEWLMQTEDNRVVSCSRAGGSNGWKLYSISRWTADDGRKLKKDLELEFEKKMNRQIYWDDVVMFCHFDDYDMGIYPMEDGDVIEIDDFEELCMYDKTYAGDA